MIKQKIKTKCGQFLMCFLILWTTYSAAENRVFSLRLKQAPMVATLQQLALEQNANTEKNAIKIKKSFFIIYPYLIGKLTHM